ncbi:MAG TPA: DUF4115 domain-containing protein, partial [Steroidobacteraceae bacterium]
GEPGLELVNAYSAKAEASRPPPPDLTQIPQAERRSDPRRLVTPLVGLGCALVLALAIWWVLAGPRAGTPVPGGATAASDVPAAPAAGATAPASVPPAPSAGAANHSTPAGTATPASTPAAAGNVTAEAAKPVSPPTPAPARETRLRLELSNESWVEVYDARGERLFYDVAGAGSVQSIAGRPPLRVVLGNAAAVTVQVDGQPRDIPAGARDGEGARFVINRSGSLSRSR